ncbi:MAG: hypothetical protein Q8P50_01715 [Bacillota bacterium]|nr:hypothetical protein [Bacillota bacterium]
MAKAEDLQYWEEPFETVLLGRHAHIDRVLHLACSGMSELTAAPHLLRALRRPEETVQAAERDAEFLMQERDAGFPSIFAQAAVMLWGALEAAVRDFMVRWLETFPEARSSERVGKVKIPLATYDALGPDVRMRFLLEALEQDLGAHFQPGIAQFEKVLDVLGLKGGVDDGQRRDLLELAAIRNLLVHRAGRADARFLAQAPWLKYRVGDEIRVTRPDYLRYRVAAYRYAARVIERARVAAAAWGGRKAP